MRFLYLLLVFFCCEQLATAQYRIEGKINLHDAYGQIVYLALINSLDDLYAASPDFIINSARVDSLGSFKMSGDDLPEEDRIYRLYLSKDNTNTFLYRGGNEENFIHLILNNSSKLKVYTSPDGPRIFQDYSIPDSPINNEVKAFYEVLGDLYNERSTLIESEAKRGLALSKFNAAIMGYANETRFPLLSLMVIAHLDYQTHPQDSYDKLELFLKDNEHDSLSFQFYKTDLVKRLAAEKADTSGEVSSSNRNLVRILIIALCFLLIAVTYLFFKLKNSGKISSGKKKALASLSLKEQEVLKLLQSNLSNKEIALELNVEVTTVKSHVQSIYKKLKIKARKEVHQFSEDVAS